MLELQIDLIIQTKIVKFQLGSGQDDIKHKINSKEVPIRWNVDMLMNNKYNRVLSYIHCDTWEENIEHQRTTRK